MKSTLNHIIEQLIDVYHREEWWHKTKLPKAEAYKYFDRLLNNGNIVFESYNGKLLGYVEFWRLNFEQWGRLVCQAPFHPFDEDIVSGYIAYVANTWIDEEHRQSKVYKVLKLKFFKENYLCDYFVGRALRKTQSQPIKVLRRNRMLKKYGG